MKRSYLITLLIFALGHFIWQIFFNDEKSIKPEFHRFPAVIEKNEESEKKNLSNSVLRRPQSQQINIKDLEQKFLSNYEAELKKHLTLKKADETDETLKLSYLFDGIEILPFEIMIAKDGSKIPAPTLLPRETPNPKKFPIKNQSALSVAVSRILKTPQQSFKMGSPRPVWIWNSSGFLEAKYEFRIDYQIESDRKAQEMWYLDAQTLTQVEKYDRIKH
ncbi:MAG: hypothetical protein KA116_03255 [Proteobacteria bacterium]|nr:hypothetical protein [Pseudomonadota bacterium]